jgi:uncharacterized protein (TIGR02466 family)
MEDSPVHHWFATPIYSEFVAEPALSKIQTDLLTAVNDLKIKNQFSKNKNWGSSAHRLSDVSFSRDFLEEYQVDSFLEELSVHVYKYMNIINTPAPKIREFKIMQSWVTQTLKGEHAHVHSHGSCDLSGAYYIQTNGEDGNIFFKTPNRLTGNSWPFEHMPELAAYRPQVGKLILFPSWLEHGVQENQTDHERLSLSFNIAFSRDHLLR